MPWWWTSGGGLGATRQGKGNRWIASQRANPRGAALNQSARGGSVCQNGRTTRRKAGREILVSGRGKQTAPRADARNSRTTRMKGWEGSQPWAGRLNHNARSCPKMAWLRDERPGGNEISETTPLFAPVWAMNRGERLNDEVCLCLESSIGEWPRSGSPFANCVFSVEVQTGPSKRGRYTLLRVKSATRLATWGKRVIQQNVGIPLEFFNSRYFEFTRFQK